MLMSVKEYAELKGKDPGNVRRNIINGRLPATKVGSFWVVDSSTPYPPDKRYSENKVKPAE